ncbi:MAG: cobalamin-dependent protein, partial [Deltaproteobacteria bacterium]|nr:cobalamin-dependent protein [Deltaproteobacteria bacterium]
MNLKVLLVRPNAFLPTSQWLQSMLRLEPYAQELIAGAVHPPHDVRICDLAVEDKPIDAFKRVLQGYQPNLVGFGGFSSQFRTNRELAAITKELLPNTITCFGGVHASSLPTDCKYPDIFDFIVRGDGVSAMKVVIAALEKNESLPESDWILPTASPNFDKLAAQSPPALHSDGINTKPRRELV